MSLRSALKNVLLPREIKPRRFPFGLGAGINMRVDFSHQTRLYLGLYEIEIAGHCRRLLNRSRSAFDIGANAGYYSLTLARRTGGPVIAVEPVGALMDELARNIAVNTHDVTPVQAFLGEKPGNNTTTLDQLSRDHFEPDFIKMDIEGHEVDALRGATDLLSGKNPHLVIEVHGEEIEAECRSILGRHGYGITRVEPRAWLSEERTDSYNGWIICEGRAGMPA